MLSFALRFGALALGIVFAVMAQGSWRAGEPPTWTIFLPSDRALVLASQTQRSYINGAARYRPEVSVEWPAGSGEAVALSGLQPSFFTASAEESESIAQAYRVGEDASVRVLDGRVYANRTDLFQTVHAVFATVFALALLFFGALFAIALRPQRPR